MLPSLYTGTHEVIISDELFMKVLRELFGHYHDNKAADQEHILLWEQFGQIE